MCACVHVILSVTVPRGRHAVNRCLPVQCVTCQKAYMSFVYRVFYSLTHSIGCKIVSFCLFSKPFAPRIDIEVCIIKNRKWSMTLIVMDLESYLVFQPLFLNFGLILLNLPYILVNKIPMQQFWMRISALQYHQMIKLTEIVGKNKNQALASDGKTEI